MKAKEVLIAWNDAKDESRGGKAPPGSIAVGPLLQSDERDWTDPYWKTGGAAYMDRRQLFGMPQQFAVMRDFYVLVYSYGLHPYVVHRAFLHIDEFQAAIKACGLGPDEGELWHDCNVCYGRCVDYSVPAIKEPIIKEAHFND
jgi:hypothetical protein